jgi:hypothetical protein
LLWLLLAGVLRGYSLVSYSVCGLHMRHLPSRRLFSHSMQMLAALISSTHCSMYLAVGQSEQLTQKCQASESIFFLQTISTGRSLPDRSIMLDIRFCVHPRKSYSRG